MLMPATRPVRRNPFALIRNDWVTATPSGRLGRVTIAAIGGLIGLPAGFFGAAAAVTYLPL